MLILARGLALATLAAIARKRFVATTNALGEQLIFREHITKTEPMAVRLRMNARTPGPGSGEIGQIIRLMVGGQFPL